MLLLSISPPVICCQRFLWKKNVKKERPLKINNNSHLSSRKKSQKEYAAARRLYRKSRKAIYNSIISDTSLSDDLDPEVVFSYWRNLLTKPDYTAPLNSNPKVSKIKICSLIQPSEALVNKMPFNTGSGRDGLSNKETNKISEAKRQNCFQFGFL